MYLKPSERKRLEAIRVKYRPSVAEEPYRWQSPVFVQAEEDVAATIKRLDRLAASLIRHWGTDWSNFDRETARKRLMAGMSFVFIPRHCGCYLAWPDAVKPEFPDKNEYDPGEHGRLWNYYQKDRPSGLRFFLVSPGEITEGEEVCRSFMEHTEPNYIIYGYPEKANYTLLKSVVSGRFIAAKYYDRVTARYNTALSRTFDSLEVAKDFIYQKNIELQKEVAR